MVQAAATVTIWIGLGFLGAHRLGWERGWIMALLYPAAVVCTMIVVRRANPEVVAERAKWRRKDTKPFDKLFFALMLPLVMVQPFAAGRDAGCAGCTAWPFWLLYPGAALFAIGWVLMTWVLVVNRHAETSVRIQTDRGHTVVTWGPYRYVRHPMYVGVILVYVGFGLIWGSRWAMWISAAVGALFTWRTGMEDRTLRRELAGYEDFTTRTRYRLLPGLW